MTCSSRSVQRSMVWVWRLRTRTASRRISQVGHWCASWRTGVRRFLVSSSTIQVNGSYDRHSRRLSRLCASAREKPRPPDDLSGGSRAVSYPVSCPSRISNLGHLIQRGPLNQLNSSNLLSQLRARVHPLLEFVNLAPS